MHIHQNSKLCLVTRDLVRDLQPSTELGPKCTCMKDTRAETINHLISWIAECSGGMLWCNGLAGTGKSSLAGTLHDHLTIASGRNRLGAFIRYDRIVYSDASRLIPSIAFSLGMFDRRIGAAISQVIKASRPVSRMPMTSAKEQFRLLLQEPLRRANVGDQGPLVVIVDGLDECSDICGEMLEVLSEGFGPELPFMRLLVFSRPVEALRRVFDAENTTVTPCFLNTASEPVIRDVEHFINVKLTAIQKDNDSFRNACGELNASRKLAVGANGLFIWAAVACEFLSTFPSRDRLVALLNSTIPDDAVQALKNLYSTALNVASAGSDDIRRCIQAVLGAIIVAKTPPGLTQDDLNNLVLTVRDASPQVILNKLGSVVKPPDKVNGGFIQLIHKSFDDFLTNPSHRGERWFIDIEDHKRNLASRCLSSSTKFLASWVPNSDIPSYIKNYAIVGPLWHIKCFGVQDFEALSILFEDQLSKWLQAVFNANKHYNLLSERIEVLLWVNQTWIADFAYSHIVHVNLLS
ncbi:hypothetical protein EDD85DRAFT_395910 [Armillaria nabsnona]|nr:hypothetical protein EDD85DRAFT_395910 [Armillaria nabsnona]